MTKIEWTNNDCPCYSKFHGSNTRRCDQDRGIKGWSLGSRVSTACCSGTEMVHAVPHVARAIRVRLGRFEVGRAYRQLPRLSQRQSQGRIRAEAEANQKGKIIRPSAQWRCAAGQEARQLLCRNGTDAASEHLAVYRLRASVGAEGAAA